MSGLLTRDPALDEYHQRLHVRYEREIAEHFRRLGAISERNGIPMRVAVSPVFRFDAGTPYRWQNIHDSIERLCEQNGLGFVDLLDGFRGADSADVSFDAWHPNREGHRIMGGMLAARVASRLSHR